MKQQKTTQYDFTSRLNHWVTAALMIGMIAFGFYVFKAMPDGPDKGALVGIHKAIGVVILVLGVWRVSHRLTQGFLPEASEMPRWQEWMSKLVQRVLLASVVMMPISGMTGSLFGGRAIDMFGLVTIPAMTKIEWLSDISYSLHEVLAFLIAAAVVVHIAGALKHHIIDKDATLRRMFARS